MALGRLESEMIGAVERVTPSVVGLRRWKEGGRRARRELVPEGAGSGFVLDSQGHVVTNDHVVHDADEIHVETPDGRSLSAELIGEDPATDVALVRVTPQELRPAELGDSETLRVGQFVLAVGNALGLPGGPTVSSGIVSALGRPLPGADYVLEGLIQTDAAINPGNSGGPLADLSGRVVGINSAMAPFAQGVGFALPINTVRSIASQLRTGRRVVRPWLGISAVTLSRPVAIRFRTSRTEGILLAEVARGGPAALAGLRPGDVLLKVGEQPLRSLRDLLEALARLPIGGAVDVSLARGASEHKTVVRIVEAPTPVPG
ncbi:MAG: trypsin-like peptidase domain-containing protein [Thermoplasmata archaeon]